MSKDKIRTLIAEIEKEMNSLVLKSLSPKDDVLLQIKLESLREQKEKLTNRLNRLEALKSFEFNYVHLHNGEVELHDEGLEKDEKGRKIHSYSLYALSEKAAIGSFRKYVRPKAIIDKRTNEL